MARFKALNAFNALLSPSRRQGCSLHRCRRRCIPSPSPLLLEGCSTPNPSNRGMERCTPSNGASHTRAGNEVPEVLPYPEDPLGKYTDSPGAQINGRGAVSRKRTNVVVVGRCHRDHVRRRTTGGHVALGIDVVRHRSCATIQDALLAQVIVVSTNRVVRWVGQSMPQEAFVATTNAPRAPPVSLNRALISYG